MRARITLLALFLFLLGTRLCHTGVVWVEESYPAAAAIQMLDGKALYHDVWFDKPPLSSMVYLLWGAQVGIPLRVAGAAFVFLACWLAFLFARAMWTEREGLVAAWLLGFFLTFGIPAAVIPLAPDLLLVVPQLAAVYLAWRGRPFWSGLAAGIGLLVNSKAVFVLAACALWQWRALPLLAAGFLLPNVLVFGFIEDCWRQVWEWGFAYSRDTFLEHPAVTGLFRTWNWAGFHAALIVGAIAGLCKSPGRWRWLCWIAIAFAGVVAGWRFFPRYYFLLLPPLTLAAARGFVLKKWARFVVLALLLVPLARFGPRYVLLAAGADSNWSDLALNRDSAAAARIVTANAHAGDTLLVWGYRPDIFVYTRMPAGSRFLDSQPLTGVIADRHLITSRPTFPELAAKNRQELTHSRPAFIVDGLGPSNPNLAITNYPDLRTWFSTYKEIGRTAASVVYRNAR
jgi:hypothetical protein